MSGFALGYAGYLLFPGQSPSLAFPELFSAQLSGGWLTRFNQWVVGHAGADYDAFPSLHLLMTWLLLAFDWKEYRRRFWIMLGPGLLLIFSTLYLRFHYAVDLLAAGGLFCVIVAALNFSSSADNHIADRESS